MQIKEIHALMIKLYKIITMGPDFERFQITHCISVYVAITAKSIAFSIINYFVALYMEFNAQISEKCKKYSVNTYAYVEI